MLKLLQLWQLTIYSVIGSFKSDHVGPRRDNANTENTDKICNKWKRKK